MSRSPFQGSGSFAFFTPSLPKKLWFRKKFLKNFFDGYPFLLCIFTAFLPKMIDIILHVVVVSGRKYNIWGAKKFLKKSSKKVKKVLDIWVLGCYYSQALKTRGRERGREWEPKSVPCKLNKEETAYANKHQIKGSFKSKDLIQKILLRAGKLF